MSISCGCVIFTFVPRYRRNASKKRNKTSRETQRGISLSSLLFCFFCWSAMKYIYFFLCVDHLYLPMERSAFFNLCFHFSFYKIVTVSCKYGIKEVCVRYHAIPFPSIQTKRKEKKVLPPSEYIFVSIYCIN